MKKNHSEITLLSAPCFQIENDHTEQSLGLAYIAAYLKSFKYDVNIVELTGYKTTIEALKKIPSSKIFGISCYSTNYKTVKEVVEYIKKNYPESYICVGGPHPTALPTETLFDLQVDSVVVGEGEYTFLKIVKSIYNNTPIYGIIISTELIDPNILPFPERNTVDQSSFTRMLNNKKTLSLISSRGCKFNCLHCNSIIMGGGSNSVRFRSVNNIISEIQHLKSLGYFAFRFNDDNFTETPNLNKLLFELKNEDIEYRIFSRLEYLTESNVKLLAESGCSHVSIGLESLNKDNLIFLGKASNLNHLDKISLLKQYNIKVRVSFMVGLPFDTDNTIENDFNFASTLPFDEFAVYPLIPYPGTKIWDNPEKYGYRITNKDFTSYVQIGVDRDSAFVLDYFDKIKGAHFTTEDVKHWKLRSEEILENKNKVHVGNSKIAT